MVDKMWWGTDFRVSKDNLKIYPYNIHQLNKENGIVTVEQLAGPPAPGDQMSIMIPRTN